MNIDFHTHILPGMDHGCDNISITQKQLKLAKKYSIDTIVATSHFDANNETVESFIKRRKLSFHKLEDLELASPVCLGCEVLLYKSMHNMDDINELCISDTNYILIEMPYLDWDRELLSTLRHLISEKNLSVILAHIDRYPIKQLKKLQELELFYQFNINSLCNLIKFFKYNKYIRSKKFVAIGSDIHGVEKNPYKYYRFFKLLHKKLYYDVMKRSKDILFPSQTSS